MTESATISIRYQSNIQDLDDVVHCCEEPTNPIMFPNISNVFRHVGDDWMREMVFIHGPKTKEMAIFATTLSIVTQTLPSTFSARWRWQTFQHHPA